MVLATGVRVSAKRRLVPNAAILPTAVQRDADVRWQLREPTVMARGVVGGMNRVGQRLEACTVMLMEISHVDGSLLCL